MSVMTAWALTTSLLMSAAAQDVPPEEAFTVAVEGLPVHAKATLSNDCDGLRPGPVYCVGFAEADLEEVGGAYMQHFETEGWVPLGVDEVRVFFLKETADGACDVVQMLYFRDTHDTAEAAERSYMAFAAYPGNLCASMN